VWMAPCHYFRRPGVDVNDFASLPRQDCGNRQAV
jgi:hypothetical protein